MRDPFYKWRMVEENIQQRSLVLTHIALCAHSCTNAHGTHTYTHTCVPMHAYIAIAIGYAGRRIRKLTNDISLDTASFFPRLTAHRETVLATLPRLMEKNNHEP